MLDKRKSQRRKMVLPVKVLVDQVSHLAHTVDITESGARLGALRTELQPGNGCQFAAGVEASRSFGLPGSGSWLRMNFRRASSRCNRRTASGAWICPHKARTSRKKLSRR